MNLESMCLERGVEYKDKGNGHIQLKGPLLVNYYPTSKKKSAYVAGTKKAASRVSPKQALDMCFEAPKAQGIVCKRPGNTRDKRKRLIKRVKKCHWCKRPLTLDTSTLEHIIPLSRGGLNTMNNLTLACLGCNQERGSDMPELNMASKLTEES